MNWRVGKRLILIWTLLTALAGGTGHSMGVTAAAAYTITDLGPTHSGSGLRLMGINSAGQVVGSGGGRGYVWRDGIRTQLQPLPGGENTAAYAINDAGQAVGFSTNGTAHTHPTLWREGVATDLGLLAENPNASFVRNEALGINASGQIVGETLAPNLRQPDPGYTYYSFHAFLWQNGTMIDLGTLPYSYLGDGYSGANAINGAGVIVGYSAGFTEAGNSHSAVLWRDGQSSAVPLGTLPGTLNIQGVPLESEAYDINDAGQVVGVSEAADGRRHAVLWQGGRITDLGFGVAHGVNASGVAVGDGFQDNRPFAALYRDGAALDLSTLIPADAGWQLDQAYDINDRGQIVGVGRIAGGVHGFLLTPAEPTFADVPPGYWAADPIDRFAARGITTGCGADDQGRRLYCPDRNVTRAEMAVFIDRTLGFTAPVPPAAPTFADVAADYWAYAHVEQFARLGITTGCGADDQGRRLYCPDRNVTRAEMAVFINRAKSYANPAPPPTATFADVPPGYWAYAHIEQFYTLGVTTGCGADDQGRRLYCPDRNVTRAEMAVFITRAYP